MFFFFFFFFLIIVAPLRVQKVKWIYGHDHRRDVRVFGKWAISRRCPTYRTTQLCRSVDDVTTSPRMSARAVSRVDVNVAKKRQQGVDNVDWSSTAQIVIYSWETTDACEVF